MVVVVVEVVVVVVVAVQVLRKLIIKKTKYKVGFG